MPALPKKPTLLRWAWCGCDVRRLVRLDRRPWMRLIPDRRLYYCGCCQAHQLLSRAGVAAALAGNGKLQAGGTVPPPLVQDFDRDSGSRAQSSVSEMTCPARSR